MDKNFINQVAKGYMEMGAINLAISNEAFLAENEAQIISEGEVNDEVDSGGEPKI